MEFKNEADILRHCVQNVAKARIEEWVSLPVIRGKLMLRSEGSARF
jgi:hypothetical protein